MAIPQSWLNLGFTSGRRTFAGNKAVGGVANSHHLTGTAADFTASPQALRAQFGPNVSIINEGDHRHVNGLSDVPYYGNRGIQGLVNGVDTSAPKGAPPMRTLASVMPKQPQQTPPQPPQDVPFGFANSAPLQPQMKLGDLAAAPNVKPGGVFGSGVSLGDILANAAMGFAAGMGNDAPLQAYTSAQNRKSQETFQREQFAAELAAKREAALAKAAEPPQFIRDAQYFDGMPRDQQQRVIDARNALYPVVADVTNPDGSVNRTTMPRTLPAASPRPGTVEDGYVFLGGDPADQRNWRQQ